VDCEACDLLFPMFASNTIRSDKCLETYAANERRHAGRPSYKVSVIFIRFWSKIKCRKFIVNSGNIKFNKN
jgi:hypothetical protein